MKKIGGIPLRDKILQAVLSAVPFDGWTDEAYAAALKKVGVKADEVQKIFPQGLRDVIECFGEKADNAMHERIASERGFARMRVRDKITFAVRARMEFLTPQREAVRRLMIWYAMPHHVVSGIKRMAKTVDHMWIAAGDNAKDYNRYTKRILLGAVLKATMLFWLNDETEACQATWEFLDRRIAEVMRFGKSLSLLQEFSPSEIGSFIKRKMRR